MMRLGSKVAIGLTTVGLAGIWYAVRLPMVLSVEELSRTAYYHRFLPGMRYAAFGYAHYLGETAMVTDANGVSFNHQPVDNLEIQDQEGNRIEVWSLKGRSFNPAQMHIFQVVPCQINGAQEGLLINKIW
jgi:hypothetical protein